MENRSGETNNPQNSAENAFDYAAADITNELPRGDMLQDPAGEPFQSTFEEEKPKKLNFFNKIGRMNPQKRAVLLVRIFIVIAFSVLFAVYCVKNRANFEIDSLAVSAVSLAVFTAVLIAAVPQIIKVFSGDDAQLAPSGIEKANGKTFLKIVLAAFVLRAALTIFGMIVFYCLNPKFQGSLLNLWQTAWTKVNTDAPHYCSIAENWYASTGEDRLLIVFFPMLPLLMRGLNLLTHNSFVSAQIINTLASCSAAGVLYLTLRPLLGEKKARLAPFIWLLLPGSIFLNSGMTEPLFMLFTVLCFYALQKKKYLAAGIAAACAGFTRSPGVLLAVPLAIEGIGYCVRRARSGKKVGSAIAEIALSLVISTFGTLAYLYINKVVAGDWFMFSVYQKSNWSQGLGFFFDTARYMYQRAIGDLKAALGSGAFNGTNITSVFVLFLRDGRTDCADSAADSSPRPQAPRRIHTAFSRLFRACNGLHVAAFRNALSERCSRDYRCNCNELQVGRKNRCNFCSLCACICLLYIHVYARVECVLKTGWVTDCRVNFTIFRVFL